MKLPGVTGAVVIDDGPASADQIAACGVTGPVLLTLGEQELS